MALKASLDIGTILQHAFRLFKSKLTPTCAGPCDGTILQLHHRWAFFIMLGSFFTVWYGWYYGKVIHCVSMFKGDQEARGDYQNICLSYPYVEEADGKKRFLLFYRWIHWSFLLFTVAYLLPRKISKKLENPKAKKLLEDLFTFHHKYDQAELEMVHRASHYMTLNMKTHNALYFKYVFVNILALVIDISVLYFIDFMFHNRFLRLIPNSYPFHRDPVKFQDYLSLTFPPFALCLLDDAHKILDGREEAIGCHLTNMEMYEKVFFILWFYLYTLIIITSLYIVYLLCMMLPSTHKYFLRTSKPLHATTSVDLVLTKLLKVTKVGDVYFLMRIKQHMSHARFYELLLRISEVKSTNNFQLQQPPKPTPPNNQNFYMANQMQQQHTKPQPNVEMTYPYNPNVITNNPTVTTNVVTNRNKNMKTNMQPTTKIPGVYPNLNKERLLPNKSILID